MTRWMIITGCILIAIGTILHFAPWVINWFGRLPGDIRIESEKSRVLIPLTSMIILSIVLSVIINLFKR